MDDFQLNFKKSEAQDLLEFYYNKKQRLIDENPEIFDKLKEYNEQIKRLQDITSDNSNLYPLRGSWNVKIQFFLKQYQNGLTARQMTELITKTEKLPVEQASKLYSSIAPTLSQGYSNGTYDREENENKDYIYFMKK